MANPVNEAAVEAVEIDAFAKDIPDLRYKNKSLSKVFREKGTVIPVSVSTAGGGYVRPSFRVPMLIQGGSAIAQGTGNGDSLGRGTGSQWVGMALSPVVFFNGCEITYLARKATQGKNRALFMVQAQELKNSMAMAENGMEAIMQGDGSGALDQIPSTATVSSNSGSGAQTSYISGMNNANQFQDQQVVSIFPSIGGTTRGVATISYVDGVANTLYFSTVLPSTGGATAVGDYIMVNGAAGSAGSSFMGLRAYQVNSNTGTLNGLARASYPGRLSTSTTNLNGAAVTMSTPSRANILVGRALGPDNEALKDLVFYCGPDQGMAIQNLYYNVLIANAQDVKGERSLDMSKEQFPETWAGRELIIGYNALPGRIDAFCPSTWYLGELTPLELYDFGGGVTVAPVPDAAGGAAGSYLTSSIFFYTWAANLVNSNPRAGWYATSAAQPAI